MRTLSVELPSQVAVEAQKLQVVTSPLRQKSLQSGMRVQALSASQCPALLASIPVLMMQGQPSVIVHPTTHTAATVEIIQSNPEPVSSLLRPVNHPLTFDVRTEHLEVGEVHYSVLPGDAKVHQTLPTENLVLASRDGLPVGAGGQASAESATSERRVKEAAVECLSHSEVLHTDMVSQLRCDKLCGKIGLAHLAEMDLANR